MESCAAGNICKYCLCECGPAELDNVWVQDWKRTKQRQPVRKKKILQTRFRRTLYDTLFLCFILQTLALSYMAGTISRFVI